MSFRRQRRGSDVETVTRASAGIAEGHKDAALTWWAVWAGGLAGRRLLSPPLRREFPDLDPSSDHLGCVDPDIARVGSGVPGHQWCLA